MLLEIGGGAGILIVLAIFAAIILTIVLIKKSKDKAFSKSQEKGRNFTDSLKSTLEATNKQMLKELANGKYAEIIVMANEEARDDIKKPETIPISNYLVDPVLGMYTKDGLYGVHLDSVKYPYAAYTLDVLDRTDGFGKNLLAVNRISGALARYSLATGEYDTAIGVFHHITKNKESNVLFRFLIDNGITYSAKELLILSMIFHYSYCSDNHKYELCVADNHNDYQNEKITNIRNKLLTKDAYGKYTNANMLREKIDEFEKYMFDWEYKILESEVGRARRSVEHEREYDAGREAQKQTDTLAKEITRQQILTTKCPKCKMMYCSYKSSGTGSCHFTPR